LLGDAVLGLVVTDHIYYAFPTLSEGDLARVRAAVVSTSGLTSVATGLGLGEAVLLGRGEEASGGREKGSILVDCLEAVIGSVYLSAGYEGATEFVSSLVNAKIAETAASARLGDPKNQLQELSAQLGYGSPTYEVSDRGPDHAKHFTATAIILGHVVGAGESHSKKDAERRAAEHAVAALRASDGVLESFVPAETPSRKRA
jgi:ribonuclease-3